MNELRGFNSLDKHPPFLFNTLIIFSLYKKTPAYHSNGQITMRWCCIMPRLTGHNYILTMEMRRFELLSKYLATYKSTSIVYPFKVWLTVSR